MNNPVGFFLNLDQDMMLWVLHVVIEKKNLSNYFEQRDSLIQRVIEAGRRR